MMLRTMCLLAAAGLEFFASGLMAEEDSEPEDLLIQIQSETVEVAVTPPVRITFAPPELSGRFVVGVFDEKGFLVRTLMTDQDKSAFDVGLNGFITSWDGKLADGQVAPPGRYSVRGYVVGDVEVEGVAFHFNDWVADGFVDWEVVADVILVSADRLVAVVVVDSVWTICAASPNAEIFWQKPFGDEVETAPVIQADEAWVVAKIGDKIHVFSGSDGVLAATIPDIVSSVFSVNANRLVVADGNRITEHELPSGQVTRTWEMQSKIRELAALESGVAVILEDQPTEILWTSPDSNRRVSLESLGSLESLAAGVSGSTVWVAGVRGGQIAVREVAIDEGVIRELKVESGEPAPARISAAGGRLSLFYAWDRATRWTCLERPTAVSEGTSASPTTVDWTIVADRRIVDAAQFGISPKGLVASGGFDTPPDRITVELRPNPLNPETLDQLVVEARSEDGQVWLTADNGLKLLPVSLPGDWTRVALLDDSNSDEITLYQGNGWVVEEFQITGLDQIASFDGGTFFLAGPNSEPAANQKPTP